jgi:transitional endoplasmic reticulum ATPase
VSAVVRQLIVILSGVLSTVLYMLAGTTSMFPIGTAIMCVVAYLIALPLSDVLVSIGYSFPVIYVAIGTFVFMASGLFTGMAFETVAKRLAQNGDRLLVGPFKNYVDEDESETKSKIKDGKYNPREWVGDGPGSSNKTPSRSNTRKESNDSRGQAEKTTISQNEDGQSETTTDMNETRYVTSPPDMDFEDVDGMDDLKQELRERVIDPLMDREKYEECGLGVDNGFLLYGPPGTEKTYISRTLAGELGINYIEDKGADIISSNLGESSENVAQVFDEARAHQPCLVFIDEIDALTPDRSGRNQHEDQTRTVNQFLEEVSAINEDDSDVVVVGATNRPKKIDDAMLRPGRLSNKIEVPPPDATARLAILRHHLTAPQQDNIAWTAVAKQTEEFTAAEMERVATEAARNAMQRNGDVGDKDLLNAIKAVGKDS